MRLFNGKTVVVSPLNDDITDGLKGLGIDVILTKPIEHLISYEQYHADMQLLVIDDTAFVSEDSIYLKSELDEFYKNIIVTKRLNKNYPENIPLNAALVSDKLFCKENALADEVRDFAKIHGIDIIDVNQGYAKCSALVLNSKSIITADKSIYSAAVKAGLEVLLIRPGCIYLDENVYGFIGGAAGVIEDTVIFFGDITTHPDAKKIIEFITMQNMKYICVGCGILKDLGGFVCIN